MGGDKTGMRIGIFGGSFDPVHNGHLEVAITVLTRHGLHRVVFVPARIQPHKTVPPHASAEQRLAMIRLAIQGKPQLSVSDRELRRPGVSFTVDTLREFRREFGESAELFCIVGSDTVPELPRWRQVEELSRLCTLIVAARPNWPLDSLDRLAAVLPAERIRRMKDLAVRTTDNPISATDLRRRLAEGRTVQGLVPDPVLAYIDKNGLYAPRG